MVEAKLYRKLALEMGIDISDIDLDEKEIKEDCNFDYIPFNDITVTKNQWQISNEKLEDNRYFIMNTIKNQIPTQEQINQTYKTVDINQQINNVVREDDISNVVPNNVSNNDEDIYAW